MAFSKNSHQQHPCILAASSRTQGFFKDFPEFLFQTLQDPDQNIIKIAGLQRLTAAFTTGPSLVSQCGGME